jgi:hypothetical protein
MDNKTYKILDEEDNVIFETIDEERKDKFMEGLKLENKFGRVEILKTITE